MSVENGASYNDVVELLNKNKRLRSNSFPCYLVNFVVKRKKKQTSYRLVKNKKHFRFFFEIVMLNCIKQYRPIRQSY